MSLLRQPLLTTLVGLVRRIGPQFVASVMATLCAAALTPMLLSGRTDNSRDVLLRELSPTVTSSIPDRVPTKLLPSERSELSQIPHRLPLFASNAVFMTWEASASDTGSFEKAIDLAPSASVALPPAPQAARVARAPAVVVRPRPAVQQAAVAGPPLDLLIVKDLTAKDSPEPAGIVSRSVRGAGNIASWAGGKVVGMLWP